MPDAMEIEKLEKRFFQAMLDKDTEAAKDLCDEQVVICGPQGAALIDQEKMAAMMQGATWTLHSFDLADVSVYFPTEDVAVIGYKVTQSMTMDDKPVTLEAFDTSTWISKQGTWLCSQHSETPLSDPFGKH